MYRRLTQQHEALGLKIENSRADQDLSQTFKISKGIDKVKNKDFLGGMARVHRTRQAGYPWNMARRGARTDIRLNSYSVRVVEK
jgi:hypothetical protein